MTIDDRLVTARPEAARLIGEWTTRTARTGIPYGRSELELGQLGELGGLTINATLRRSLTATPNLDLALRDVPAQPATLGQDLVRVDALSLVRQLEHRIADLPALAARLDAAGVAAADEAARAQAGLSQPFKHTDALQAATTRSAEITIEMQHRQQPAAQAATENGSPDAAATDAQIERITRASFPTPATGAGPARAPSPTRRPSQRPGHDSDVSRGRLDPREVRNGHSVAVVEPSRPPEHCFLLLEPRLGG